MIFEFGGAVVENRRTDLKYLLKQKIASILMIIYIQSPNVFQLGRICLLILLFSLIIFIFYNLLDLLDFITVFIAGSLLSKKPSNPRPAMKQVGTAKRSH